MRKIISKKDRFEVFKRDSFTCQYCGAKAPDVLLHVDHIKPVSKGGDNSILNLITSCQPCNSGKSDRDLSDDTVIKKQQNQLNELNDRREQLDMMLEWHNGLKNIKNYKLNQVIDYVMSHFDGIKLTEKGIKSWAKIVNKHDVLDILSKFDEAYLKYSNVTPIENRYESCYSHVYKYLRVIGMSEKEQKARYIRAILKDKIDDINYSESLMLIMNYISDGYNVEQLQSFCANRFFKNYRHFKIWIES